MVPPEKNSPHSRVVPHPGSPPAEIVEPVSTETNGGRDDSSTRPIGVFGRFSQKIGLLGAFVLLLMAMAGTKSIFSGPDRSKHLNDVLREGARRQLRKREILSDRRTSPQHPAVQGEQEKPLIGHIGGDRRQRDRRLVELTDAILHDPGNAALYNDRGLYYFFKIQDSRSLAEVAPYWDLAIADLTKAIELDPGLVPLYVNRAGVYKLQKKFDLAIADLRKATDLDPNYGRTYYIRGLVFRSLGEIAKAKADLAKAKELGFEP